MVFALAGIAHAGAPPVPEEASVGATASTAASAVPAGAEREFDEHAVDASRPAARVVMRVVFIAPGSSSHRSGADSPEQKDGAFGEFRHGSAHASHAAQSKSAISIPSGSTLPGCAAK
jgi:hypothetical protein